MDRYTHYFYCQFEGLMVLDLEKIIKSMPVSLVNLTYKLAMTQGYCEPLVWCVSFSSSSMQYMKSSADHRWAAKLVWENAGRSSLPTACLQRAHSHWHYREVEGEEKINREGGKVFRSEHRKSWMTLPQLWLTFFFVSQQLRVGEGLLKTDCMAPPSFDLL